MALINTMAQITLISGISTEFKQGIPYNLKRVTEHEMEDKEMSLILITETITLPTFLMHIAPIVLKCPIVGFNVFT